MNHQQDTRAFTTVSGMIDGVVKAISIKPAMMAIKFISLANVMVSAFNKISGRLNAKRNQNQSSKNDEEGFGHRSN